MKKNIARFHRSLKTCQTLRYIHIIKPDYLLHVKFNPSEAVFAVLHKQHVSLLRNTNLVIVQTRRTSTDEGQVILQAFSQDVLVVGRFADLGYDRVQGLCFTVLGDHILNAGFAVLYWPLEVAR